MIDTDMNSELNNEDIKEIEKEIPLRRVGKPEEIAKTVKWIAETKYITGQVIRVDGGWLI